MAWARRSIGRSHLVGILLVSAALLVFADVSRSGAGRSGSDSATTARGAQPSSSGKRGTGRGAGVQISRDIEPEIGEMDPRLAEALNAFGSGRYDECRKLAEDLISTSNDSSTRAECVGIIILSHLDQGDFDGARKAAEGLRSISPDVCQDLLQQVNREERGYNAKVSLLQQIVATTNDIEVAARAQLLTARVHQMFGRLEIAKKSYRKVLETYPASSSTGRAVTRMAGIAAGRGDFDGAVTLLQEASEGEHPLLIRTDAMSRIAAIELRRGRFEEAERIWWGVIDESVESPQASDAIIGIVDLRRRVGDLASAFAVCEKVIDRGPDTQAGVSACEAIAAILMPPQPQRGRSGREEDTVSTPAQHPNYQTAITRLSRIAAGYSGTAVATCAKEKLASMHLEEGLRLRQARSYLAAAQQLEEALAQGMLDDRRTLTALHTIGLCYDDMDQMHKAIPYLEQALEVAKEERQRFDICWTLGVCHYKLHDYEEGYHLLKLAAAMDAPANLKEIADEKAAECIMQAEAAGRPFEP